MLYPSFRRHKLFLVGLIAEGLDCPSALKDFDYALLIEKNGLHRPLCILIGNSNAMINKKPRNLDCQIQLSGGGKAIWSFALFHHECDVCCVYFS